MYSEEKTPTLAKQPEHLSIAMGFANEMLERFSPKDQNEMLKLIRQRWAEQRSLDIEKAEKQAAYIKGSLLDL